VKESEQYGGAAAVAVAGPLYGRTLRISRMGYPAGRTDVPAHAHGQDHRFDSQLSRMRELRLLRHHWCQALLARDSRESFGESLARRFLEHCGLGWPVFPWRRRGRRLCQGRRGQVQRSATTDLICGLHLAGAVYGIGGSRTREQPWWHHMDARQGREGAAQRLLLVADASSELSFSRYCRDLDSVEIPATGDARSTRWCGAALAAWAQGCEGCVPPMCDSASDRL